MKAALYVRVSTDEQAREGFSIPAQKKALEEYCYKNSIGIYKIYTDEGISGAKENRPAFQDMLKDAVSGKFQLILVHKFDRFARKVELSQRIKNQLKKANINVISITEPISDSPVGFLQEGIMELFAEYYIKNLSAEVKKGQREKISQGQACNMLALGYKNINGKAVIVPDQAEVVKKIFHMYSEGYGTQQIAEELNSIGIPTYKNGKWNTSQINYILKNVTYIGVLKWAGQYHLGIVPPIIDKNLFDTVQTILRSRNPYKTKRKVYYDKFIFLGLLHCGYCGAPMRISKAYSNGGKGKQTYYYYACSTHRYNSKACNFSSMFKYQDVDKSILENIHNILTNANTEIDIYNEDAIIYNRRQQIQNELERAKKAYLAEVFTLEEYSKEKVRLENELSLLETKNTSSDIVRKKIKNMLDEYRECKTIQEKKAKLQSVIKEIKVFKDYHSIEFHA
ncbi:MAG: recombinase family protein [Caulobacteraceae bacterium]